MRAFQLLSLLFVAIVPAATAQVAPPAPAPVTGSTSQITKPVSTAGSLPLDVVVTGRDGKPVAGLEQGDFKVLLDKKPQPILSFTAVGPQAQDAVPVHVILLVDAVNTRYSNIAYERDQMDHFLRRDGGKLARPTSIAVITDTGTEIMPGSTQDGNKLAAFLDKSAIGIREFPRSGGFYDWTEQFQISATALERIAAYEQTLPGRKILIWISPGWPLLSGPEVQLTSGQEQSLFRELVALSTSLRKAQITLSSVDPLGTADSVSYRTFFYQQFEKGVTSPNKMQIGNLALQVLALQSGGRVLNSSNDVAGEIAAAASDADAFYVLAIQSPPAEKPDTYRSISVYVDKPGLKARTRTGYYAQP
jgi:VWFA-related protein